MIIGDGEKMPGAFIQPNFSYIRTWAEKEGISIGETNEDVVSNQNVINKIQQEVDFYNEKFGNWEKIKRFELTPNVWSIDGGELTPTLKLKRKIVKEKYIQLYNKIYNS